MKGKKNTAASQKKHHTMRGPERKKAYRQSVQKHLKHGDAPDGSGKWVSASGLGSIGTMVTLGATHNR